MSIKREVDTVLMVVQKTRRDLSVETGVSYNTLCSILSNFRKPRPGFFKKMWETLDRWQEECNVRVDVPGYHFQKAKIFRKSNDGSESVETIEDGRHVTDIEPPEIIR